jgi:hypothetical protein
MVLKKSPTILVFFALLLSVFVLEAQIEQPNSIKFGITTSLNYGYPQIEAIVIDRDCYTYQYNSKYSAGLGAQLVGVCNYTFSKKLGIRTGMGLEWPNHKAAIKDIELKK